MAQEQSFVHNLIGWMRRCIEEKWYETETMPKFKGKTVEESQMTLDLYQEYLNERDKSKVCLCKQQADVRCTFYDSPLSIS